METFWSLTPFRAERERGGDEEGRHFQLLSVSVCVSQKCGAAARLHFMGKSVSHHCVLSGCQTPTGLVGCCGVCVCVCEQTLLASESSTGRQSSDRLGAFELLNTGWVSFWTGLCFHCGALSTVIPCHSKRDGS